MLLLMAGALVPIVVGGFLMGMGSPSALFSALTAWLCFNAGAGAAVLAGVILGTPLPVLTRRGDKRA